MGVRLSSLVLSFLACLASVASAFFFFWKGFEKSNLEPANCGGTILPQWSFGDDLTDFGKRTTK